MIFIISYLEVLFVLDVNWQWYHSNQRSVTFILLKSALSQPVFSNIVRCKCEVEAIKTEER